MFNYIAASTRTRYIKAQEKLEARRNAERGDEGLETLEVVILTAIIFGLVVALGAVISAVVNRYSAQIGGGA